ncbi:MAG TPA: CDP-alcohol phosphatidyltransferase family protein, partial [Thermoanaerobaculia bacterium]|nr:CDP-alcohol phosphatidyltransferase family protein [Thermoanaerobaculia bacterium]
MNLRRGVYIVPTTLTLFNVFFGFRAILFSMKGMEAIAGGRGHLAAQFFETACLSIVVAAIFDTFDGLVARQLGAT